MQGWTIFRRQRNVQGMGAWSSGDCVIVLSHSPDAFPAIIASEAADGGKWADLVLSGHTHGGQFRLLGWSPRIPSTTEKSTFPAGWRKTPQYAREQRRGLRWSTCAGVRQRKRT